jgi:hypothetical protein
MGMEIAVGGVEEGGGATAREIGEAVEVGGLRAVPALNAAKWKKKKKKRPRPRPPPPVSNPRKKSAQTESGFPVDITFRDCRERPAI